MRILCVIAVDDPASASYAPQAEADLKLMLRIAWSRGPDLPQGFQDSAGGVVDHHLVSTCGFCQGRHNDKKPGKYPRGFLNKTWAVDLNDRAAGWGDWPPFPGAPRQGLIGITVNDALYCWGGFSYSEPFCYSDGHRLVRQDGEWRWDALPPMPGPLCAAGFCAVGSTIYICGGADYNSEAFFTETDHAGQRKRLGAQLWAFDTAHPELGWKVLPACPGTPRFVDGVTSVGGKVYVIGGAGVHGAYCTVVDNWCFDPKAEQWTRLRDLPIASGNFPAGRIVYSDRYIVLCGGYQYEHILGPEGELRKPYGAPRRFEDKGDYFNDIFVYDTKTGLFGRADSMPLNNNCSMALVHNNALYLIGGETGGGVVDGVFYGHHPELFLKGKICVATDAPKAP